MNKNWKRLLSAAALVAGLVLVVLTRSAAIAEGAEKTAQLLFSGSLILTVIGLVALVATVLPAPKAVDLRTLTTAAMFAALCYIGFAFFRIDIPVGSEKTAFHLGNVFCVLAALFLGSLWGGLSGAVGLTIADLTSGYVTSAPKTFLLKLCIGLIVGLVAKKVFHIDREGRSKTGLAVATVVSCVAGMGFNVVADPVVGYFYKMYVLGVPQEAANIWVKMGAVTTLVNAIISVVAASLFYLALRPAVRHAGLHK